jgi:hypothetical protein
MARDFQEWNNDPGEDAAHLRSVTVSPHSAPPNVERLLRAGDSRRKRRWRMILASILLTVLGICIFWWMHS